MAVLTLPVPELAQAVNLVKGFVAGREASDPLWTQMLFVEDTIRGYSGDSGAGAIAYGSWKTPHPFTVEGDRFSRVVQSLAEQGVERVKLEVGAQDNHPAVVLRGGGSTARFLSMVPEKFPLLTPPKLRARAKLTADFWEAVAAVEFAASRDDTRPEFCGVYWDGQRVISADRARLTRRPCAVPLPKGMEPVLIPTPLLARFADHRAGSAWVGREESSGLLWFFLETAAVCGPLWADPFPLPGVEQVFATARAAYTGRQAEATWCVMEVNESALQRLDWFVDAGSPRLVVEVDGTAVRCTASHDHSLEEVFKAQVKGPPGKCIINVAHFREALLRCNRFGLLPGSQVYFFKPGQPSWEHVVVPYNESA